MYSLWICLYVMSIVLHLSSQDIPYNSPHPKVWWAKQINSDIHTAGRLTERQLKYAVDAGFKSIVSQYYYSTAEKVGDEVLPTTEESRQLVQELGGVDFYFMSMPEENNDAKTLLERFNQIMPSIQKPILYYCQYSDSATFTSLLFLAGQSRINVQNQISSHMLYKRAASLGFSISALEDRQLVAEVIGEDVMEHPPQATVSMTDWYKHYWMMKPIHANWYNSGQTQSNFVSQVKAAGFQVVLNTRRAVSTSGKPSQEEVFLLNIKDGTGVYDGKGRQSEERLLETRISTKRSAKFIGGDSTVNYESMNAYEFGDHVGYNETLERLFMEAQGLDYFSTPVGGEYKYSRRMVEEYVDTWLDVGRYDHVFLHCRSGYRAGAVGILAAGLQYNLGCEWALDKAKSMGYHYDLKEPDVVKLFDEVLCEDRYRQKKAPGA